jgi:hypothetical protein
MKRAVTGSVARKSGQPGGRPAKQARRRSRSFATAAEPFRGMLKTGPRDLSTREGFGR